MLDIGWSELLVIAIVLIVVVGPKDLPPMLRAFGKMTSNLRRMAGEFRSQFDEALRESDLDEVRKTIADAQSLNPANSLRDALNPLRQMGDEIKADLQKATAPVTPPVAPAPAFYESPEAAADPQPETTPAPLPAAPVTPVVGAAEVPAKPRAVRKPRAKAETGEVPAAAPRKRAAKTEATEEAAVVKKAAPRKKKTVEPGKDEA